MDTHYQTLVLNRLWQAVNVVGVERSFSLLSLDHAQVIYAEDGSFRVFDGPAWFEYSKEVEFQPGSRVVRTINQQVNRIPKGLDIILTNQRSLLVRGDSLERVF